MSSYCDRVGHKLPIVLSLFGNLLSSLCLAVLATKTFLGWPIASVLVFAALNRIFGGVPLVRITFAIGKTVI